MPIKIEKGVPVPTKSWRKERATKYPFSTMEIGDSFFVAGDKEARAVQAAASRYIGLHEGVAFTTRRVKGGLRCWRIRKVAK